ncbi:DUF397 domain-containing protein [Sphaerimonospora cavernae]|uniref:DUF397 domain-containing protein n=1 Tax=Sphaerimonospora cavernae TaxID=1740611 RepID=A0ABV6U4J5_9ACTN
MDLNSALWRKSSFSGDNGGNCVEVTELEHVALTPHHMSGQHVDGAAHKAGHGRLIAVRDSKDPDGPKLFFTSDEWSAFLQGVKADEFDLERASGAS